jgi:hypothetical protein
MRGREVGKIEGAWWGGEKIEGGGRERDEWIVTYSLSFFSCLHFSSVSFNSILNRVLSSSISLMVCWESASLPCSSVNMDVSCSGE